MKRGFVITLFITSLSFTNHAQDMGYRTFDVGVGYQYIKDGMQVDLHLAFNAEEHHSIVIKGSYITANGIRTSLHKNEEGNGWGGSIGYRYHFSVVPKRFFLGARAGLWNMNIHWNEPEAEADTKLVVIQPALEMGYTAVINDQFFITPYVSATLQKTINTKGEKVVYGDAGFVPMAGLTMGWRF